MAEYQLKYVMTTTIEINTLAEITQQYLSKKSSRYVHLFQFDKTSSSHSKMDKGKSESSPDYSRKLIRLSQNSIPNSKPPSNIASNISYDPPNPEVDIEKIIDNDKLKSGESTREFPSHKAAPIVSSSSSIASVASSSSATGQLSSSAVIDIDESFKLTSTRSKAGEKYYPKTTTKYSYTCTSEIGHNIDGSLPLLIEFQKKCGNKNLMTLIAYLLREVIRVERKKIAIIHFESATAPWLYQLLQVESCFNCLTLTDDVEKFLTNTSDKMVLVNSYDTVKGLEFSEVLLILEKDEYFLKQYIPEAITRCTSNLSVLVRPPWKGNKNNLSNTVACLVDHWKEVNNDNISKEKKPILKVATLGFCPDKSCKKRNEKNRSCSDKAENLSFYGVHKHTKWYKASSKEIEKKIAPIMQLEDEKRDEEATAL